MLWRVLHCRRTSKTPRWKKEISKQNENYLSTTYVFVWYKMHWYLHFKCFTFWDRSTNKHIYKNSGKTTALNSWGKWFKLDIILKLLWKKNDENLMICKEETFVCWSNESTETKTVLSKWEIKFTLGVIKRENQKTD